MPESMQLPWPLSWETVARFWSRVEVTGPGACWHWRASQGARGHGRYRFPEFETQASRIAWALAHGRPPAPDLQVLHTCDNPPCCNPAHLYEGTHADNMRDMAERGRSTRGRQRPAGECVRGVRHGHARLSEDDVRRMRAMSAGGVSYRELARLFNVTTSNVGMVVKRRTWRHVV